MTTLKLERVWGGDEGRLPAGLDTVALTDDPTVAWVLGAVGAEGRLRAVDVRTGEKLREHAIPRASGDRKRAAVSRVAPDGTVLVGADDRDGPAVYEVSLREGTTRRVVQLRKAPRLVERLDDGRVVIDAGEVVDPRSMARSGEGESRWLSRDGGRFLREVPVIRDAKRRVRSWDVEAASGRETELRLSAGRGVQGVFSPEGGWFFRLVTLPRGDLGMERWSLVPATRGRDLPSILPMSARIVATRDDGLALVDPGEFGQGGALVAEEDAVVDYDPSLHAGGRWSPAASCVSPDGRRFGRVRNGVLRVTSLATGAETVACDGHFDAVRSVALSHDGAVAVGGGADGQITVWDVARSDLRWRLEAGGVVIQVALSPDARRLYAVVDHYGDDRWWSTLRSWDVHEGIELTPSPMEFHHGARLALSPDGTRALVASGEPGRQDPVWVDLAAWRERRYTWKDLSQRDRKPRGWMQSVASFSEDGARAVVHWGSYDVWHATVDARTGGVTAIATRQSMPRQPSERVAAGPTLTVKGTDAGEVQLLAEGRKRSLLAESRDASVPVTAVAIARDERTVAVGTADGRLLVYRVEG